MSANPPDEARLTVPQIAARKGDAPLVCLTAYHAPMARLLDDHADMLLVGDSLAMVLYGFDTTLAATPDMMIAHARAVMRGSSRALVAVDMPFGSYEESPAQAFRNAARMLAESGCQAVKLEGGRRMAETIGHLVENGIPVLGHIGLTPQSVHRMGGFKVQGKRRAQWAALEDDADALVEAGCFALVLEGMAAELAARITARIPIPTIGIGASPACDGQILVAEDMLGLTDSPPRFVKTFADLGAEIAAAAQSYAEDVRARRFPEDKHTYAAQEGDDDKSPLPWRRGRRA